MQMRTECVEAQSADGRRVAVWRSVVDERRSGPVVVVGNGFGRRMRDSGAAAMYLACNGATVYRYDSLDHVGLSDGDILDFCMSSSLCALITAVTAAREREGTDTVVLAPLSLSALPAYDYAAVTDEVVAIVALLGVVDGCKTLARVFGEDYTVVPREELPATVKFERHLIDPRALWDEYHSKMSLSIENTKGLLAQIAAPVTNIVAADDEWVDPSDVRAVFDESAGTGPRRIVELTCATHGLARNPAALRLVLGELTAEVMGIQRESVWEPSFEELLDVRVAERARERAERTPGVTV